MVSFDTGSTVLFTYIYSMLFMTEVYDFILFHSVCTYIYTAVNVAYVYPSLLYGLILWTLQSSRTTSEP